MNYRYQPPTDPRPDDDDDDSQYDEYAEHDDPNEYGFSRYRDEYDTDRSSDDSGGTATWLKVVIAIGAFLIVAALVLSSIGPAFFGGGGQEQPTQPEFDIVDYVSAIDPSTIVVDLDGEEVTVKLIGIESAGVAEWFDAQVVDAIHEALDGTAVTLEQAGTDKDADGNLLRYVYLSNRSMLNELLVRNGFARVADVAPDNDRYLARMRGAEELARVDELGVWGLSLQ